MAVTAIDVQLWFWKMLKASSKNCVVIMSKYPYVSCSFLCFFFLYICFPLLFWVLIYSSPLVVVIVKFYGVRNGPKCGETEKSDDNDVVVGKDGKPFKRVHSVRRRRAKDIKSENNNVDEKLAVSSTSFSADQVVDKSTLIEECPNEIRDVEVDSSASSKDPSSMVSQNSVPEFGKRSHMETSDGSEEDEKDGGEDKNKAGVEWTDEDEDNVAEVGISENERNKRLESLITRRRARKLLSLQVRRTLMNMDRNDLPAPMASLVMPKHNNASFFTNSHSSFGGQTSTTPGSAPSVLMPMRNPFDLPYDPQEEKPDLTGNSFEQEFTSPHNRDMVFCRHESFSLGASLPEEFNQNREKTAAYLHDFGFSHRVSPQGYEFYTPGTHFHRESTRTSEPEPSQETKANSISDSEDDHIKEVIQVHENNIENNDDKDKGDEVQTIPTPNEDSTTTSDSSTSSEEDTPFFKIDKEAVLKNLFSPRTNAAQGREFSDQIGKNLNYVVPSRLERNSLEEHMYRANRAMRRHAPSYSIASDLQVEISEVSSPPTVDDNFSYRDEDILTEDVDMEQNMSLANENLFGVDGNESRLGDLEEFSERDLLDVSFSRINSSDDLLKALENSVNGKHKIDSGSSMPSVPKSGESGQGPEVVQASFPSDSLQFILPESITFLVQENEQQSTGNLVTDQSHGNDSRKRTEFSGNARPYEDSGESSRSTAEHEQKEAISIVFEIQDNFEQENQHHEGEPSSATHTTLDDPQAASLTPNIAVQRMPAVQSSSSSPKSVLQPSFSVDLGSTASFDQYIDQETHQFVRHDIQVLSPAGSQIASPTIEHSTAVPGSDGDVRDVEISQESSESLERPITEAGNIEFFHENGIKGKEVSSGSEASPAPLKPTEETAFSDDANNSNSLVLTDEHQKEVNGDVVKHDDSNRSRSYADHRETSALPEDTGNEHTLDNPSNHKGTTNSSSLSHSEVSQDEPDHRRP